MFDVETNELFHVRSTQISVILTSNKKYISEFFVGTFFEDTQIFDFPFLRTMLSCVGHLLRPCLLLPSTSNSSCPPKEQWIVCLVQCIMLIDFRVLESSNLLGLFECMEGTNISHLGKRKIIFKSALGGDMLGRRRVCTGKHVIYPPWN